MINYYIKNKITFRLKKADWFLQINESLMEWSIPLWNTSPWDWWSYRTGSASGSGWLTAQDLKGDPFKCLAVCVTVIIPWHWIFRCGDLTAGVSFMTGVFQHAEWSRDLCVSYKNFVSRWRCFLVRHLCGVAYPPSFVAEWCWDSRKWKSFKSRSFEI